MAWTYWIHSEFESIGTVVVRRLEDGTVLAFDGAAGDWAPVVNGDFAPFIAVGPPAMGGVLGRSRGVPLPDEATDGDGLYVFGHYPDVEGSDPDFLLEQIWQLQAPSSASDPATVADALLGRSIEGGADGGRTVGQALAALRNRVARAGSTLTVYAADDATPLWTAAITTDAHAAPMVGVDPS